MLLTNTFTVPAPPEEAWPLLLDVPRIAPCLPGAELTEVVDERTYKGRAAVKVGPVALSFAGTAEIAEIDEAARTALIKAKGADAKGRGAAQAQARFALTPEGAGTRVTVETDVSLTGAVAQYGRASGLMQEVANQLVGQFARNLESLMGERRAAAAAPEETAADAPAAGTPAAPSHAPQAAPQPATPISGIGLLFSALKAMILRWLGRGDGRETR